MTKQQLSERIAELYNVRASKYVTGLEDVMLIDDTARMFELAVEHDIYHVPNEYFRDCKDSVDVYIDSGKLAQEYNPPVTVLYKDHPTKLEATLYAIGLALVKKAEMKGGE